MISIELVNKSGVITGLILSEDNDPKITIALPDRYIGDGNDIAEAVLMVLFQREREKLTDVEFRIRISQYFLDLRFPAPEPDMDDWEGDYETLADDDFYYFYTP